ncbi:MAG: phosphogluconate dehydratase [Hyphomicrobiaceae bacterium]
MTLKPEIAKILARIERRSRASRRAYLDRMAHAREAGPSRGVLSCGNLAHVAAACPATSKRRLAGSRAPNLGIVTAYNDMLSAHQPFERFPALIRKAAGAAGATAQVAGGVPAMCDGVTQGQPGMELSLFSRDVIALSAAVALSHNAFDAVAFLGVCDKIVPGLVIAAATFGHLPAIFLPAGPMTSGLPNDEKAKVRERYARGEIGRDELLKAEMQSYHGPGTCTFYGTANSNQMLMEVMGLHLPGASFVNPNTPLRDALTVAGVERILQLTALGEDYVPASAILTERAFVNGIVGLHATGGSTNLVIHLIAMARAAGILLEPADFADLSSVVPLVARVYPSGTADVNHFHAAGGLQALIGDFLASGLLLDDVMTVAGPGLSRYTGEARLEEGTLRHRPVAGSHDPKVLRAAAEPFQPTGGLEVLTGNLGTAIIKVSAIPADRYVVTAPAAVFSSQGEVEAAFRAGRLDRDVVVVVRFQGPRANGMPELHTLTPALSVLQAKGHRVALLTDGRMSGASGKVPAAIHVTPEAADGGPIARIVDGDMIHVDARECRLEAEVSAKTWAGRKPAVADLSGNQWGMGRELFQLFRSAVGPAVAGASPILGEPPGASEHSGQPIGEDAR